MAEPVKTVAVERTIAAPPERVWSMLSDVSRMGEWSPETTGCEWRKGASGPAVGARFRGRNELGKRSWKTDCVVTDAEPGRAFAFEVKAGPIGIARWEYRIEQTDDGGSRVEERWTDLRHKVLLKPSKLISGVDDRASHNRESMEQTLERLAAAAESAP